MAKINESDYITKYDTIAFTGHSLGGNLAIHATIMSTLYENILPRVKQGVNFDGPGYSREYFEHYKEQIQFISRHLGDNFCHYQWSIVGNLLEPVPGINFKTLQTKKKEGFLDRVIDYLIMEHSTENIVFDEKGNVIEGKMSVFENVLGKFTEFVDRLPAPIGNFLVDILGGLMIVATWDNKIFRTVALTVAIAGAVVLLLKVIASPVTIVLALKTILAVVAIVAAVIAIGAAIERIFEVMETIGKAVADIVGNVYSWTKNKISQLIDWIQSEIAKVKNWFNRLLESLGYAVAKPFIEVDTYKLRQYAERLENVRKRIRNLDSEMNSLYFRHGLLDLLDIIRANRLPSSWQMKRVINYLEDTASAFEKAERKIIGQIN